MNSSLLYNIGITLLPGIDSINSKNLIAYCGSAELVFKAKKSQLEKIPGIGSITAEAITHKDIVKEALTRAEKEIKFIEKEDIHTLLFTDTAYPFRLKQCEDSPVLLYTKGQMNMNAERMISIVGSRRATDYGKKITEQLIEELTNYNVVVVSGLAYGIDICAHRKAIKNNLATLAVVAHGLDNLYPTDHYSTSCKMLENGGLITEFISETKIAPEYFPRRNRIVAGMTEATIVIEASVKSGALITSELANSYDRDVFAVPGRLNDSTSSGCNRLIKTNKAALIESAQDVIQALNWDIKEKKKPLAKKKLFQELSNEEELLVGIIHEKESIHIDELSITCKYPMSKTSMLLLNLEFSGIVKSLPGKMYTLNN